MASRALQASGERKSRNVRHGLLFNNGLGNDDQLVVLTRNVEVVDVVAEVVAVGEDAAAGTDGEREGEAVLIGVGAGVHARFHDALADRARVAVTRKVPDGITIHADRIPVFR